ncbi:hypothetical protein [Alicyclobacillus acidoterrestris]|uniref:Uncharacterized protein n=1 Tax=Alicyclobacillus acidoterrestris (strain ATCC 49025 / DSM 3922 / CIP 106132 / NCIMB 13137 / GD3B) TaxID=1356854 RepID=T0BXS1_ALIAG|nr:hypothetical protein [Alicyclobacillus acidoterrestris]EPZ45190.1 hypothetical protein N007_09310 [Alicyclobacillus acidoterrestris ATCC 49025]UNO49918.1 hypothetical protein K1I37_05290 [Alicyclobacillus acidoterrestris]
MARFDRFRWLPILIRAYYDAQSRLSKEDAPGSSVQSSGKRRKNLGKDTHVAQASATGKSDLRTGASQRKLRAAKPVTKHRNPATAVNRKLLAELQEANRKLQELSVLQQKIHEIGTSLDVYHKEISELKERAAESGKSRQETGPVLTPMPATLINPRLHNERPRSLS